jgi:hypothetical protein
MARPTKFNRKVFDFICGQMAEGVSLREICRAEGMPPPSTVRTWAVLDIAEGVAAQYARAREAQAEAWVDETIEIADDATNDWVDRRRRDGTIETVLDREHVERSKIRIQQRNWVASKFAPRKFGGLAEKPEQVDDQNVTIKGGLPD